MKLIVNLLLISTCSTQSTWAINLSTKALYKPLIIDRRATLPGDQLTVIVLNASRAQTSADLSSSKVIKTTLKVGYNNNNHENQFEEGKSLITLKTERNRKIRASLKVRIKNILPNGTYLIEGRQMISINGEQQQIILNGILRPEDISPQNTVLSTSLADAHISYINHNSLSRSKDSN